MSQPRRLPIQHLLARRNSVAVDTVDLGCNEQRSRSPRATATDRLSRGAVVHRDAATLRDCRPGDDRSVVRDTRNGRRDRRAARRRRRGNPASLRRAGRDRGRIHRPRDGAPQRQRRGREPSRRTGEGPGTVSHHHGHRGALMRRTSNRVLRCFTGALLLAACSKADTPDAYGNFEANEVVVSSQAAGQLQSFTATEGATLAAGATVAVVDTTQLALERAQTVAQRGATEARAAAAGGAGGGYAAQLTVSRRNLERTRRLIDQKAATAPQLDQAERDYQTIVAQIAEARAQQASVMREVASSTAHIQHVRVAT